MKHSLQLRLAVATLLVALLFLGASAVMFEQAFSNSARLALRERTLGQLYLLMASARFDTGGTPRMPAAIDLPDPRLGIANSGLYAFVARDGDLIWHSPSWHNRTMPTVFALSTQHPEWRDVVLNDGADYLMIGQGYEKTSPSNRHVFGFFLLAELEPLHRELASFRSRLWIGLGAVGLFLILSQTIALRWSLRPLRRVAAEITAIETGERQLIEGQHPVEIRQLVGNINILLTQERARQTRYRNAMADLAHSLKTPLAVLQGAADCPESLASTVTEQAGRMTAIVERQLQRAAAMHHSTAMATIAIRPQIDRILVSLDKVYRDKGVLATNGVDADFTFRGDEADLLEVLGNLIENGYKWCRGRVYVQGLRDHNGLTLVIHDDGPGIDPGGFERILQRGARADESAPGHGIGLAVVADIVHAYRGQLTLACSLYGGAAVAVQFLS